MSSLAHLGQCAMPSGLGSFAFFSARPSLPLCCSCCFLSAASSFAWPLGLGAGAGISPPFPACLFFRPCSSVLLSPEDAPASSCPSGLPLLPRFASCEGPPAASGRAHHRHPGAGAARSRGPHQPNPHTMRPTEPADALPVCCGGTHWLDMPQAAQARKSEKSKKARPLVLLDTYPALCPPLSAQPSVMPPVCPH